MTYHKLVRDKIPSIIRSGGRNPIIRIADDEEYWQRLKEKLFEELEEFVHDESLEELADLLEVIQAVAEYKGFDLSMVEAVRQKKADERGRFKDRVILVES